MAIQVRRGANADFDESKMLAGELAVTTDGTRKVYAAFAANDVKELVSKDDVQGLINSFTSVVDREITEAEQRIESKGETVLGTIPDEYEIVSAKADEAVRTKADAIVCTVSGVNPVAKDSSNDYLRNLKLYGKTTQGENPSPDNPQPLESKGKWGNLADNVVIVSGTRSTNGVFVENATGCITSRKLVPITGGQSIYINTSIGRFSKYRYYFYDESETLITTNSEQSTSNVLVAPTNARYFAFQYAVSDADVYIGAMLMVSEEDLPYRPYSGQKEVESAVHGKNLLNIIDAKPISFETIMVDGDDIIISPGNNVYGVYFRGDFLKVGKTYTLNLSSISDNVASDYFIRISYLDGDTTPRGKAPFVFTPTKVVKDINIYIGTSVTISEKVIISKLQLELGSTATEYEPYTKQSHISLVGDGLKGIPVTDASLATYTDKNGKFIRSDEKNHAKEINIQRIYRQVFTGEETITKNKDGQFYFMAIQKSLGYQNCFCTHYLGTPREAYDGSQDKTVSVTKTAIWIRDSNYTKSADLKAMFAEQYANGTPVTVDYMLETPIETPLTASEIASYKALHSNYKVTAVMNDCECYESITYNADTETWINNKIEARVASALASLAL